MTDFLRQRICLVLVLLLCTSFSVVVCAQSTTEGGIGGVVTDQSKAVVPNAKVTVINVGTNQQFSTTTDATGRFRVAGLQPGTYRLTAVGSGFAEAKLERVVVEIGLVTSLEIPLSVTGKSETVEVVSEAPVINTTSHDFTTNLNETAINELPINGRRWSEFAKLTPGATPDGLYGLISFRGISGLLNNSTIDGGDNNQAFFSEERGRTRLNYAISQAAIQEFQVNTSNFSAEYGRAAGAVVNAVTKSGTNAFHGSGFYYNRDERLAARNPFSFTSQLVNGTMQTVPLKPEDRRHQFGGTIGGPIAKDKLFFFFSYDQQKRNFPAVAGPLPSYYNPITVSAPADCAASGLTSGQILSCRGVTQAQTDGALSYLTGLTGLVPRKGDQRMFLPKVDWRLNPNNTFSVVWNRSRWTSPAGVQTQATVNRGSTAFGDDFVSLDSVTARLSSALGSYVSNELRFQWSEDFEHQNPQTPLSIEPLTGPGGMPPAVTVGYQDGGPTIGMPNFLPRVAYPDEKRNQFADNISIAQGRHLFKFGADFNHVNDVMKNLYNGGGNYSYDYLYDFITDYAAASAAAPGTPPAKLCRATISGVPNSPAPCYYSFTQAFGPSGFTLKTNDINWYANDEFRLSRRVTLNLGVRYEYQRLPAPQVPNPALPQTFGFNQDKNNWGPRTGIAIDLTGDGKTVFRGGYGIYYGRIINATLYNAITNTGMTSGQTSATYYKTTATGGPLYPATLSSGVGKAGNVLLLDPKLQNPRIQQADMVLEREIAHNTVVSVSYLMSRGDDITIPADINLNPASGTTTFTVADGPYQGTTFTVPKYTGARPNTNFGAIVVVTSAATTSYDAMVVQLNRRMTKGLQIQANYTFAHSLDDNQNTVPNPTSNSPLDPLSIAGEHGNSAFDTRHRFVGTFVYAPQFGSGFLKKIVNGFSIAPIVVVSSGRPFTPTVSGSVSGGTASGLLGASGDSRLPFVGRNTWHYPTFQNVDLRISRRFKFAERYGFEVLAEAFNLTNNINPTSLKSITMYRLSGTTLLDNRATTGFGIANQSSSTLYRERQVQMAARFTF